MRLPEWVIRELATWPERFTGNVKINWFEGGVANITVEQSVKAPNGRMESVAAQR